MNAGQVSRISPSNQPPASVSRTRASTPSPDDLEGAHRRVPLHHQLSEVESVEVAGDEAVRRRADEDAARACRLLQSRSDVRGIADRRVVHAQIVADLADHHGPGVDPDPHPERGADLLLHLPVVVAENALDPERRVHSAARTILVRDRRAEERHDAVAGILIDRPLEAVDLRSDELEAAVDDPMHVFGVEPFSQ